MSGSRYAPGSCEELDIGPGHSTCGLSTTTYRVGQIKRGQLTFLLVTSERIYEIKRFLAGIK